MIKWLGFTAGFLFLLVSVSAFAGSYDYSDATGYVKASNEDASWQLLGKKCDVEEINAKAIDTSDDGVFWSIDGGQTWDNTSEITAGTTVKYRFDMYKN